MLSKKHKIDNTDQVKLQTLMVHSIDQIIPKKMNFQLLGVIITYLEKNNRTDRHNLKLIICLVKKTQSWLHFVQVTGKKYHEVNFTNTWLTTHTDRDSAPDLVEADSPPPPPPPPRARNSCNVPVVSPCVGRSNFLTYTGDCVQNAVVRVDRVTVVLAFILHACVDI